MSKVKIEGHGTGTGTFTVTTPSSNTDRTITLPDATGTLLTADGDGSSLTGVGVDGISSSADATAMTITSDEKIGIGTTSPTQKLHVAGNIYNTGYLNTAGSGTAGGVQFADANLYMYRDTNDLAIKLQGAEKVRIQSGGGISFNGDTASANALNDYEEGTHTVTATCSTSGSVTLSSSNNKFTYTKIGNLVTVTGRLDVSAISSPNGDLYFSLPFAIAQIGSTNNTDTSGGMFVWYPVSGDSGKWVSWADAGTSVIYVRHGDGVQPPQSANLVRVSTEFRMNFSYRTA